MERLLTSREREVLDALLVVEFEGVEDLRAQAREATVVGGCTYGCPSIDFFHQPGVGMHVRVNAAIRGPNDGLFLFTLSGRLAGIEYVGVSDAGDPSEFPDPSLLVIEPSSQLLLGSIRSCGWQGPTAGRVRSPIGAVRVVTAVAVGTMSSQRE